MENINNSDSENNIPVKEKFFIISHSMFILLNILSFGLYQIWWMYKAWRVFQVIEQKNINPALRAYFSIIYMIPLLNKIKKLSKSKGNEVHYSSVLIYFIFSCLQIIAAIISYKYPIFIIINILSIFFLLAVFDALNNSIRGFEEFEVIVQENYNLREKILMIIGGLIWFIEILNLFVR